MDALASLAQDRFGPVAVCQPFREKILGYLPRSMQRGVARQYMRIAEQRSYREANLRLLAIQKSAVDPDILRCGDFLLTNDDQAICDWAEAKARRIEREQAAKGWESAEQDAVNLCAFYGFDHLEDVDLLGAVERYKDARWWRKRMRQKKAQVLDQLARDLRLVNQREQIYLSDDAFHVRRELKARNAALLGSMEAENQHGESFTLAELAEKSVSKPENRRNELMVRMRGFEEVATQLGHVGDFVTITCPSKYHANSGSQPNPKYQGYTPKEANDYLTYTVWAAIRKELDRRGLAVYGFRVVEPHADGCPHWHLMLFMPERDLFAVRRIIERHALADDHDEPGAKKYRCKFVLIDPKKGTAAGYIAKYISKNIDGHAVDKDLYGRDAIASAARITEWAGTWCIRQFQQIGGPSVTIWRELRRLSKEQFDKWSSVIELGGVKVPALAAEARQAADWADWAAYVLLMGGPLMRRADRPIQLYMMPAPETDEVNRVNRITGEIVYHKHGRYGDLLSKIKGVCVQGCGFVTRFYTWSVRPIKAGFSGLSGASAPPWTCVNNCP